MRNIRIGLTLALAVGLAACGVDAGVQAGDVAEAPSGRDTPASTTTSSTTPSTTPQTAPDTDPPDTTADSTTTTSTTAPRTTFPDDDVPTIELGDKPAQDYDEFVEAALNEIQRFWRVAYERIYGDPYEDLQGGVWPVYPGRLDVPGGCGMDTTTYRDVEGNAFYCGEGDFIAYDDSALFPVVDEQIGRFALAVALAHEWGHAIQSRADFFGRTLLLEQQADCFAGAFVGHLAAGDGKYIDFEDSDLVQAINGLILVRDEPGSPVSNPNAHGSAFDRIGAFQDGFFEGAGRCKEYDVDPPTPTLLPFGDDAATGGNAPYDELIGLLQNGLDGIWSAILQGRGIAFTPPTIDVGDDDTSARCEDVPDDALRVAFYCASTNTVVASDERLRDLYDTYGDNAPGVLIATAYSEAVQRALGSAKTGEARFLVDDCLTGAWMAHLLPTSLGVPQEVTPLEDVAISAGDLDEAIQTLVAIGDDTSDTDTRGSPFEKIDALRTGVLQGLDACIAMIEA